MDESDFLAELDALTGGGTDKPKSDTAGSTDPTGEKGSTTTQSMEDELFDLLNGTETITPIKSDPAKSSSSIPANLNNDDDFLSWLEETPKRANSEELIHAIEHTGETNANGKSKVEPTTPALNNSSVSETENQGKTGDTSMDAFLNDVLGSSEPVSTLLNKKEEQKKSEYEQQLEALVDSPFPDLGALRLTLDQGGYIPHHLRGKVLILLLTGRAQLDDEALNFSASNTDKQLYQELMSDCEGLIQQEQRFESQTKVLTDMISDVVYLYCQRRNVEYKNVFSRIMLSILGSHGDMPKSVLSSCFYSLAANFLPLVSLQYSSLELATGAVHFWLRLLVTYHNPALAQHLDRVLPGWEKCAEEMSTQQVKKINTLIHGSNKLDQLEKELGINMDFDFEDEGGDPVTSTSSITTPAPTTNLTPVKLGSDNIVESASPKTERTNRRGMISTNWMISFFSGNIPASESAKLLDWSVFNGERFAGVYFLTTLLDLHAEVLLQMNGPRIMTWFENIERNKSDWFKDCKFLILKHTENEVKGETEEFSCKDLTWEQFTNGWIRATANLICNTPKAFRESLPRTETWAVLAADRQSKALSTQFKNLLSKEKKKLNKSDSTNTNTTASASTTTGTKLDEQLHGAVVEDRIFDDNESDSASEDSNEDESEDRGEESAHSATSGSSSGMGGRRNTMSTLMGQLRAVASSFRAESMDTSFDVDDSFVQDQKLTADTICLWSNVEEVLPCICSHARRKGEISSSKQEFLHAIRTTTLGTTTTATPSEIAKNHSCFFLASLETTAPLYYAIDCRRMAEKTIGLFPKAYSLDPEVIYDGEGLDELLQVLAPIAATTHIVIIGSGKDYFYWLLSLKYKKKTKKWKKELKELIEEESRCLNALAMILIKKHFKYISILQGGFYEAVHFLHKPESNLSLNTALVDIDRLRLASMLGIGMEAGGMNNLSPKPTLTSRFLNEAAPAALKSVGNFISNLKLSSGSSTTTTTTTPVESVAPPVTTTATSTTTTTATTDPSANTVPPASDSSTANNNTATAKQMFSGFGKTLGLFGASSLDTLKKGISAVAEKAAAASAANNNTPAGGMKEHSEDQIDDGLGPRDPVVDDHKISVVKSDQERAQALALHRMSGLSKGDQITISRAELPGAILFPCTKIKEIWIDDPEKSAMDTKEGEGNGEGDVASNSSFEIGRSTSLEEEHDPSKASDPLQPEQKSVEKEAAKEPGDNPTTSKIRKEIIVSRYLVVSRERFMVLDADGGGIGSLATVKSNHHLTELTKMTFRKKDPELVNLHILGDNGEIKVRKYRVTKYHDFINTLTKHMERFK